jgi:hypothetical protein
LCRRPLHPTSLHGGSSLSKGRAKRAGAPRERGRHGPVNRPRRFCFRKATPGRIRLFPLGPLPVPKCSHLRGNVRGQGGHGV